MKMRIDQMRMAALKENRREDCLFLLSGSQAYHLMQNASETLAGRLAVIPMQGISFRERKKVACALPFSPEEAYLSVRDKEDTEADDLWRMIHRGSMPRLVASDDDWETFYSSYTATYIERDVNQLTGSQGGAAFRDMGRIRNRQIFSECGKIRASPLLL